MQNKKFILNADDFGMSHAHNTAVKEGFKEGVLKSTSLVANGEAFDEARKIWLSCPELGVGVHLNIIEGKSLTRKLEMLTDINGNFNKSYLELIINSYKPNNRLFMEELEQEFSAQIELVKNSGINITHIDSHVHTHAIPPIFELVCRLAKEYGIKQVRTQHENFYMIPDVYIHLKKTYLLNIIKVLLLNIFTKKNKQFSRINGLKTNDYLIGVGYTSMMNNLTVLYGLASLRKKENITVEVLIHPCRYDEGFIDNHFNEYCITKSKNLKEKIEKIGYEITNYLF